jgi:hypothetical protein
VKKVFFIKKMEKSHLASFSMARTKKNGVEIIHKRKITQSDTEESEEEQQKQRKVFKKNHVFYVSEWIPDTDGVSGEIVEGGTLLPVKLKENIRLETKEESVERKAVYAEAKRIENEKKLEVWRTTAFRMVEIRSQAAGLNKSISYDVSPSCYLGSPPYERIVTNPQVFTSCIQVTRKNAPTEKKVYIVVGMLVELFSKANVPVLLHSIILHQEAPHR